MNGYGEPGTGARRPVHPLLWVLIVIGGLTAGVWVLRLSVERSLRQSHYEREIQEHLTTLSIIAGKQEQYEATRRTYWREDVVGLADLWQGFVSETKPSPLAGLLFRAIRFADEVEPDPRRYAVLLFPPDPRTHEFMYVITQDRRIWRKSAVGGGILVFPTDPAAEGWEILPR